MNAKPNYLFGMSEISDEQYSADCKKRTELEEIVQE